MYRATLQATVSFSSSIQLEMVTTHQHQLGQVFGDPAANKVQRMHRYDRNCLSILEDCKEPEVSDKVKVNMTSI